MTMTLPSLKPSVASGIDSIRKRFKEDPYFRSTVSVITVQTVLAAVSVVIFGIATMHQQREAVSHIVERRAAFEQGVRYAPGSLEQELADTAQESFLLAFVLLTLLSIAFGAVSARYALAPTRAALSSQRRFIGNLAHELRTPLSVIRMSTEVALLDPARARQTMTDTLHELDRVSQIVNNLLSFQGLLRTGQLTFVPIELQSVIRGVIDRHQDLARVRGIALSLETAGQGFVDGNTVALEQVFTNLVKNALTYTPAHDGRSVTVRVWTDDGTVCASVTDTGIGIAHKDLRYVFEPFYRGDTAREHVGAGTSGLGLAIVNDIVRAHQGTIVIRSALNRGTSIEVVFPASAYAVLPTEPPDDLEEHEARIIS
jgi:signal transduction histidine kinase